MARPKKDNHPITIRIEQILYERLNLFVTDSGQSKTVAIERALNMYLNDYYKKQRIIQEFDKNQ